MKEKLRNFTNGEQNEPMQFRKLLLVDTSEENSKLYLGEETDKLLRPSIRRILKYKLY